MDQRNDKPERRMGNSPRAAPGSKPRWKIFIPYMVLGLVLLVAAIWIYVIGPRGQPREPMGETLREPATSMQIEQRAEPETV